MNNLNLDIPIMLCSILAFIPAIVLHEVGHGFAAYKLGDPTAKRAGRLSLNPLKHLDPFGTVVMPLLLLFMGMPVFGYAKPVPYNPSYFKNKRIGDLVVGLAGPLTNLLQALLGAGIIRILFFVASSCGYSIGASAFLYLFWFFEYFVLINLYLMVFNLIPIPPLDGSSILALLVPRKYMAFYYKVQAWALPVFFLLVIGLPYFFNVNPIAWLLQVTAGNLFQVLMP